MYDRLLVPVDGSDPTTAAVEHTLAIAADLGTVAHILHVANTNESSLTRGCIITRSVLRRTEHTQGIMTALTFWRG